MHLTDAEIILLLRSGLKPGTLKRAKEHLADCDSCTERVAFMARVPEILVEPQSVTLDAAAFEQAIDLATRRPNVVPRLFARFGSVKLAAGVLAAAAIVVFVVTMNKVEDPLQYRSGEVAAPEFFLSPSDGISLHELPSFHWSPIPLAHGYRIELFQSTGLPIWSQTTSDTFLRLPVEVGLTPGKAYLWRIEALLQDTRSHRSEIHRFVYAPGNAR